MIKTSFTHFVMDATFSIDLDTPLSGVYKSTAFDPSEKGLLNE